MLHEDKLWLVPYWRDNQEAGYSTPERMVLLETLPHTKSDGKDYDFLLELPVPKAVFDGLPYVQKEVLYVVKEDPGILFPYKAGLPR
jgi:hypothetical protein